MRISRKQIHKNSTICQSYKYIFNSIKYLNRGREGIGREGKGEYGWERQGKGGTGWKEWEGREGEAENVERKKMYNYKIKMLIVLVTLELVGLIPKYLRSF